MGNQGLFESNAIADFLIKPVLVALCACQYIGGAPFNRATNRMHPINQQSDQLAHTHGDRRVLGLWCGFSASAAIQFAPRLSMRLLILLTLIMLLASSINSIGNQRSLFSFWGLTSWPYFSVNCTSTLGGQFCPHSEACYWHFSRELRWLSGVEFRERAHAESSRTASNPYCAAWVANQCQRVCEKGCTTEQSVHDLAGCVPF